MASKPTLVRNDRTRLRLTLALVFAALAVPSAVLVHQAYQQMQWESFLQYRLQAEELARRIDERIAALVDAEEARSFADYDFLVVSGDASANFVQPSALSQYPVPADIPGLVAHFQVDTQGEFSTPLLPGSAAEAASYGIGDNEYLQRLALGQRVHSLLSARNLARHRDTEEDMAATLTMAPNSPIVPELKREIEPRDDRQENDEAASVTPDAVFRQLQSTFDEPLQSLEAERPASAPVETQTLGRVEDIELDADYAAADEAYADGAQLKSSRAQPREKRKEQVALPELSGATEGEPKTGFRAVPISTFDAEVEPFDLALLDVDHLVIFRRVFRGSDRFVQGAIIDKAMFFEVLVAAEYRATGLSQVSHLALGFDGDVFRIIGRDDALSGSLLYRASLSAPFSALELLFTVTRLPIGPGGRTLAWSAAVLAAVLVLGFGFIYRLGVRQIQLNRQQQDFVAAVSHELKTPLTSIRMYGEMLREGWVQEDKRRTYYDFIFHESERLSRLIANVLELARLSRNSVKLEMKRVSVPALLDLARSKVANQIERAGLELEDASEPEALECSVEVDLDAFSQVVINLVDNAVKFAGTAEPRRIELVVRQQGGSELVFAVRDFGAGVPRSQLRKIFRLFYRSESELTRETVGTGIGLALVHQLVTAMNGRVDVVNRDPGAEFRVFLPLVEG